MTDDARRALVVSHIQSVARRPAADTDRLVADLVGGSWPGGGDRTEPGAREWLRRWRPARRAGWMRTCACARGACPVCN
jgi:hypothetical protein